MINLRPLKRVIKNPMSLVWWLKTGLLPRARSWLQARLHVRPLQESRRGKIVLLHIGRSGSTVLGDLLGQDSRIFWDGEVLKQYIRNADGIDVKGSLAVIRERSGLSGADRFYGCEVKPFHIARVKSSMREYMECLAQEGFTRFIVLERKNYLRKIISSVIAAETSRWHNSGYEKPSLSSVTVNPDRISIDYRNCSLLELLDGYRDDFRNIRTALAGREQLWLTFEDDVEQDPAVAYGRICEFLGMEPEDVTVRYARTNPWPLHSLVKNYEDIRSCLEGTDYAWMTRDG